jgi:hypothetical protein
MRKLILLLFFSSKTPLHWLGNNHHAKSSTYRLLVESKADVNAKDKCQPFPLSPSFYSLSALQVGQDCIFMMSLHTSAASALAVDAPFGESLAPLRMVHYLK